MTEGQNLGNTDDLVGKKNIFFITDTDELVEEKKHFRLCLQGKFSFYMTIKKIKNGGEVMMKK